MFVLTIFPLIYFIYLCKNFKILTLFIYKCTFDREKKTQLVLTLSNFLIFNFKYSFDFSTLKKSKAHNIKLIPFFFFILF